MYCYYAFIFYMTGDRLVGVVLHIRYPLYWGIKRAKQLVIFTFVACCLICICMCITFVKMKHCNNLKEYQQVYTMYHVYIPTALDITFLLIAICTYRTLFDKFRTSRRKSTTSYDSAVSPGQEDFFTTSNLFVNSRFHISVLIVTSFLLFKVVPGLIYTCFELTHTPKPYSMLLVLCISFKICDTAEAVTYVFLQRSIKRLLRKKVNSLRTRTKSGDGERPIFELRNMKWSRFVNHICTTLDVLDLGWINRSRTHRTTW